MSLPLEGIKVLDFSIALMGPLCALMLGDMGAEVVKVERLTGEAVRRGKAAGMEEVFG
ncbi:MAG: formyl-CoA transferase, partial [Deltaproteobacteria bacterium CG12_big_fil_rev_8_21_14_0_65_43_10]